MEDPLIFWLKRIIIIYICAVCILASSLNKLVLIMWSLVTMIAIMYVLPQTTPLPPPPPPPPQVLVPKEPDLMGKTFEVVITSAGKHYLIGEIVRDSLVHMPHRPHPLPYGTVSTCTQKKAIPSSGEHSRTVYSWLSFTDALLLLLALCIVCVAVLVHYGQLYTVFR